MEWSNEDIMEFLDLYEGEPTIWNPQNADHKDRNKIYEAWKRIRGSISVECSLNELKKKKENLMATYRKLASKVKNGTKTNEPYKPEWFAYEKMASFLHSVYIPRNTKMSDVGTGNEYSTPDLPESSEINSTCYEEKSHDSAPTEALVIDQDGSSTSRKRKLEEIASDENRMDDAYNMLKQIANRPKAAKDESTLFCDLLCLKLKALDDNSRDIAMHEINMLMFNLKKNKILQPYWSYNNSLQQPGHFTKTILHDQSVQTSADWFENSSSS